LKRILIFVILVSNIATAQITNKQTLLNGNAQHGGFITASAKVAKISDAWFGMLGFRMGWIINRNFSLNAAYYALTPQITHYKLYAPDEVQPPGNGNFYLLDTTMGGIEIEYLFKPHKQVHLSTALFMGMAHIFYQEPVDLRAIVDDRHIFLEPTLNINLNVSDYVKLVFGLSYRFTSGVKAAGLDDDKLAAFTATTSLAVGIF
jgi:hypothetical protein